MRHNANGKLSKPNSGQIIWKESLNIQMLFLFRYHILDHCDFSELLMLLSIFMLILLLT